MLPGRLADPLATLPPTLPRLQWKKDVCISHTVRNITFSRKLLPARTDNICLHPVWLYICHSTSLLELDAPSQKSKCFYTIMVNIPTSCTLTPISSHLCMVQTTFIKEVLTTKHNILYELSPLSSFARHGGMLIISGMAKFVHNFIMVSSIKISF